MTDEQRRRIDDHRPAVGLQWDENNPPPRTPIERPEQWTILLTSGNHGLVGSYGHTFPHAEGDHERINVVDEAVVIKLRERVRELEAAGNTNKAVLADEQIDSEIIKHGALEFDRPDQARSFARAIEAAVLANASKAVVAEPSAWMHEDGRVVTAATMAGARKDGGAILSSLRGYTIPLYAAPAPADNPSTTGAASIDTPEFRERLSFMLRSEYESIVAYIDARLAAPALNPSDVPQQTAAARDVLAERRRQVEQEGWTPEHDDEHSDDSMVMAAICYAMPSIDPYRDIRPQDVITEGRIARPYSVPIWWPQSWSALWWKPKGRRANLVRAAALLLADIERIDRAAAQSVEGGEAGKSAE